MSLLNEHYELEVNIVIKKGSDYRNQINLSERMPMKNLSLREVSELMAKVHDLFESFKIEDPKETK